MARRTTMARQGIIREQLAAKQLFLASLEFYLLRMTVKCAGDGQRRHASRGTLRSAACATPPACWVVSTSWRDRQDVVAKCIYCFGMTLESSVRVRTAAAVAAAAAAAAAAPTSAPRAAGRGHCRRRQERRRRGHRQQHQQQQEWLATSPLPFCVQVATRETLPDVNVTHSAAAGLAAPRRTTSRGHASKTQPSRPSPPWLTTRCRCQCRDKASHDISKQRGSRSSSSNFACRHQPCRHTSSLVSSTYQLLCKPARKSCNEMCPTFFFSGAQRIRLNLPSRISHESVPWYHGTTYLGTYYHNFLIGKGHT
jgi:hypothetical protein